MNTLLNENKSFLKALSAITAAIILTISAAVFSSCAKKEEEKSVSAIRGTYTYQNVYGQDKSLRITSDSIKATSEYKYKYLFCSTYPERNAEDQPVSYTVDQRLKLFKDFTYFYEYSIKLANPQDWGGSIATVNVSMSGTFTYYDVTGEDKTYVVKLSNPIGGTHTVYGARITDSASVYGWSLHGEADFVEDLGYLSTLPDYNFDKYTRGRTVKLRDTVEDKILYDDIFFTDIIQDISKYFNF